KTSSAPGEYWSLEPGISLEPGPWKLELMKTLYLDIFSGISGDMFLGAMIDLGVDSRKLERELERLRLDGWHTRAAREQKANISGVKFDVQVARGHSHPHTRADGTPHSHPHSHHDGHGHEHGPAQGAHGGPLVATSLGQIEISVFETNVPPRFRIYLLGAHGNIVAPPAPRTIALETVRPGKKRQLFKFKRQADYLEATEELPEPHEFTAVLKLKQGARKIGRASCREREEVREGGGR